MRRGIAPKREKSQVLISAIFVLAIVVVMGTALLFQSRSFRNVTRLQVDTEQAHALAKSGIRIAESFEGQNPQTSMNETYASGDGTVKVEVNTTSSTMTSTGSVGKSTRVLTQAFDPMLASSLVAYWKFEGSTRDETGKNHGEPYVWKDTNGDNINEAGPADFPEFVPGIQGQAIRLRRLTGEWNTLNYNGVVVPDSPSLDITQQITLCAWFKHEDSFGFTPYGHGKIMIKPYIYDDDPWELYSLGIAPPARFIFTDGIPSSKAVYVPFAVPDYTQWHHYVGTYDGNVAKSYIDGEQEVETDCANFAIGKNNQPFYIGGVERLYFHMVGLFDEVMIFNRALSAAAIKKIYDSQKP